MIRSARSAVSCSLALAAVSTFGDFVWAMWIHEHRTLFGLAHGALLGAALGLALGVVRGRPAAGALYGAAIILATAASFYALYSLLGYSAMFVAWMGLWIAFGVLGGRGLRSRHSAREAFARGALAAVGSGSFSTRSPASGAASTRRRSTIPITSLVGPWPSCRASSRCSSSPRARRLHLLDSKPPAPLESLHLQQPRSFNLPVI